MSDIRYYLLITPNDGIHVVERQWFDFEEAYNGTFLPGDFATRLEAEALRDKIMLSCYLASWKALVEVEAIKIMGRTR
jgi:hypothetical protein